MIEFLASPRPFLAVVAGVVCGGLVGDQTRGQLVLFCPNFVTPGIVAVSLYLVAQQCIVNVSSAFVIIIRMLYSRVAANRLTVKLDAFAL